MRNAARLAGGMMRRSLSFTRRPFRLRTAWAGPWRELVGGAKGGEPCRRCRPGHAAPHRVVQPHQAVVPQNFKVVLDAVPLQDSAQQVNFHRVERHFHDGDVPERGATASDTSTARGYGVPGACQRLRTR